nr:DUF3696 domain-containing protein [Pseudonocardia acidicola]
MSELDSNDVALYFFDNRDGATVSERIPISDDGGIERESWPAGFFEEQLRDSMALALAQSRGAADA